MKSYFIFIIVLTVVYAIYYAVIIYRTYTEKREQTNRKKRCLTSATRKRNRVSR